MVAATIPVAASTTATVQVPTVPVKLMPGMVVELEATLWAEGIMAQASSASGDAERFMKGM